MEEQAAFYKQIRKYFVTACDYMKNKFPLNDVTLKHAEVADISMRRTKQFSSVRFFVDKFPVLLGNSKELDMYTTISVCTVSNYRVTRDCHIRRKLKASGVHLEN